MRVSLGNFDRFNIGEGFKTGELIAVLFLLTLGFASIFVTGSIPRGEDAGETFVFITIVYYALGIVAYWGFVTWRELRLIRNTPTSKIRSMPMGTVEVKGTAEQGPENVILKSPFSDEDCLFYKWMIQEYRDHGKNSSWDTISSGTEGVRFVLDDGTGEVIVDPEGADLEMPMDNNFRVNSSDQESEEIREFLNEKGIGGPGGFIADNDRRYMEWFVTPGEDIYLFGYASNEKDENGEYPILKQDSRAEMFMISDKSEKELTKSKKWRSALGMIGGSLGALLLYASLLAYTGVL